MSFIPQINPTTYYLGVNDRTKELFENLWPLPKGVSYNSYLIKDEKTVLIDTVDICYSERFFSKLAEVLQGQPLDYLIVNHMEPDHSGSIRLLKEQYPEVKIVSNKKALGMLQGFFGIDTDTIEVTEQTELPIGSRSLRFVFAPMVHWPEVMFTYDPLEKTLYSADAFGSFGTVDGAIMDHQLDPNPFLEDAYRYYSNIVGKYGNFTQKALAKAATLEIETICSTHGPVWRTHLKEIVGLYDRVSKHEGEEGCVVAYGSMYGHTEEVAEKIGYALGANGVKRVILHNLSKSHPSYVLADIFRYKALIVGSPTYNNSIYPYISQLLQMVRERNLPNRLYACFGGYTWSSAAVKILRPFAEEMKWTEVADPIEIHMSMNKDQDLAAWKLGEVMAQKILQP